MTRNTNCLVLSAPTSGNATGSSIDSNQIYAASFQASFGGDVTAAGDVKIQASNDVCGYGNLAADFVPTNWTDIPNASATVVAGASVLITVPLAPFSYRWLRVVFTRTGGAGTITVNMSAAA